MLYQDSVTQIDEELIRECYRLASSAVEKGNHPFGALLAVDGKAILKAENSVATDGDRTSHAELNLIRRAMRELEEETLRRSALYTSCEPCVMCSGAIYWAQIPAVFFGCSAASLQAITGEGLLISCREVLALGSRETTIVGPILEGEGRAIHEAFWV